MNIFRWQFILFTLAFIVLVTGLVTLLVSRNTHNRTKAIPYAMLYGIGVIGWLSSLIYTVHINDILIAHRFSFATAYFLVLGALGLALTFPNSQVPRKIHKLLLLDVALGITFGLLIFFTDAVVEAANFYGVHLRSFSLLGSAYLLFLALHLIITIVVFVVRYLKEVRSRLYFNYIVLSFTFTCVIGGTTNLLLPVLGVTAFTIFGPLSALLPFISIAYALGIGDINDIQYVIAQLLQVAVRVSLIGGYISIGYFLGRLPGVAYYSSVWVAAVAIIAGIGIVAFYMLGRYVDEWINRNIAYSNQTPEQIRSLLIPELSGEVALGRNVALINRTIKNALGLRAVGVVVKVGSQEYKYFGDFTFSRDDYNMLPEFGVTRPLETHDDFKRTDRFSQHTPLRQLLDSKNIQGLMPLRTRSEVAGYYVLGDKFTQDIFTRQDIAVLRSIIEIGNLSIERALFYDRIQEFNATLQEEVDEATRKLKRQNKRLEELDDIKDDFISMASHQLRTPLTAIKGYLSMVLEGDAGKLNAAQAEMLRQSFASSQRMVFLITDLLNVSRLKTGKFIIDAAPLNLADVIGDEVEQLQETAHIKGLELIFQRPTHLPELMLDDIKIRQVIMNFIDNAIYYTPTGGRIKVELTETPSAVELRVTDNGIGVPRAEQHHLFTKFYRATNARKARPDGTGLGLFMAHKVVIAQGGSIIFSSAEGKGSTFGFSFPKHKLRVPEAPKKPGKVPVGAGVDK